MTPSDGVVITNQESLILTAPEKNARQTMLKPM
jgi:hypothetical protein